MRREVSDVLNQIVETVEAKFSIKLMKKVNKWLNHLDLNNRVYQILVTELI